MNAELREAVSNLHREKSAAYGNAWKKRGEVMSVLANLARKVDRLAAHTSTRDETVVDTAADLLVYAIKYQTFLADNDTNVADTLFDSTVPAPYSDGTAGFDALWDVIGHTFDASTPTTVPDAIDHVERTFDRLEHQFVLSTAQSSPEARAAIAAALVRAAASLLAAVTQDDRAATAAFIDVWTRGTDDAS